MIYNSPIGPLAIVSDKSAITNLTICHGCKDPGINDKIETRAAAWLDAYFSRRELPALPPLSPSGSSFQIKVWREMCRIPYGCTLSYGELARRTGTCARAVGGAVGANPIAILMPCHRVIASDGSLGGFAYGSECKRFLLGIEAD